MFRCPPHSIECSLPPSLPPPPLPSHQMLEQLNMTLEEEKKTLLTQVNKLLEQNQGLLVRTLESKDQALEEERHFK